MVDDARIHIHHVGGRDGEIGGMPLNPRFVNDCFVHIYEADPSCVEQISEVNTLRGYPHEVVVSVLGEARGRATLHRNYCACTSSLLPTASLGPSEYKASTLVGDYLFAAAFRTVKTSEVETVTLDESATGRGVPVDVLSLDTQGTEDAILRGAPASLRDDAVCVVVEVAFREVYRGQMLFGALHEWLTCRGFELAALTRGGASAYSRYRGPLGWRGRGVLDFEDAIYLRTPEDVRARARAPARSLRKLAFMALTYGRVELALECLDHASACNAPREGPATGARGRDPLAYEQFLGELWATYRATAPIYPPRFDELFSEREADLRFAFNIPHHWNIYDVQAARERYFGATPREAFIAGMPALLSDRPTPLETLLSTHGFGALAREVGARRCGEALATLGMLHVPIPPGGPSEVTSSYLAAELTRGA